MTIRQLRIRQSNKYPFKLGDVLNGTQDFRWCRRDDGWYCGVLAGHHIHVRQCGNVLEHCSGSDTDLTDLLSSYLRLDDPIEAIYDYISSRCDPVAQLVKNYPSLRLLRHPDPWECMVSYIYSVRSDTSTISRNVEAIAKKLGDPIELCGEVRYTFPTPETVLNAGVGLLEKERKGGLGRAPGYVITAAERTYYGELDLCRLAQPQVSYDEAKRQLMQCSGIGPKVSDCIALFALDKTEAFPVDVHVRRAVASCFPSGKLPSDKKIMKWAQERFGPYAGYAEPFLFYDDYQKPSDARGAPPCEERDADCDQEPTHPAPRGWFLHYRGLIDELLVPTLTAT